jgi:RNA polymerase sigma factor (sigma-70 family)
MMQMWFHALTRKLLPARPPQTYAPGRRRRAIPRLEVLEDRIVLATPIPEPPGLPAAAPAVRVAVVSSDEIAISSVDPGSVVPDGALNAVPASPSLKKLLEDIQNLATPGSDLPGQQLSIDLDLALRELFGPPTPSAIIDQIFLTFTASPPLSDSPPSRVTTSFTLLFHVGASKSLPPTPPSPGAGEHGSGTHGEMLASELDAANILAQPTPPGSATPSDKNYIQPGTDPGRMPSARQAVAPEVPIVHRTSLKPATHSPDAGGDIQNSPRLPGPSQVAGGPNARPTQDNASPAVSGTNGGVSSSGLAGTAVNPAAQTELELSPADLPDGLLLERFVVNREQTAFTAIVERYEEFVLGICQRTLGDSHAALDAVQATFLVLARKASLLDKKGSLAGWLWKVAYRIALRLRALTARQRRRETEAINHRLIAEASEYPSGIEQQEMFDALSEELQRLPQKYREPLVLCYLDGRTHAEAARTIGLPRGSMAKRIAEGLRRLRERMLDRGFLS